MASKTNRDRQRYDTAALYEYHGAKLDRLTAVDHSNEVRFIMSNRIKIDPELRAIGNYYGACVETLMAGRSGEAIPVFVDLSSKPSTGVADYMLMVRETVQAAEFALNGMNNLTFEPHGKAQRGPHDPIPMRVLIDGICVFGCDIADVAQKYGWWVRRDRKGPKSVPDKQTRKLKAGLILGLHRVRENWDRAGITVSGDMANLEVRG